MLLTALLFLLAHAPFLIAHRWGRERATLWLLAAPVLFVGFSAAIYGAEVLHLIKGVSPAHRPMRLLAKLVFGFGFGFPAVTLSAAVCNRARYRRLAGAVALVSLAIMASLAWALVVEPQQLAVRHYEVVTERAPLRTLRILHVSDLQTDGPCRRERLAADYARSADPDLVIFTGDLMNGDDPDTYPALIASTRMFLQSLHARLGVFGVVGDWDGWGDDWPKVLAEMTEGSTIRFLRNETVAIDAGEGTSILLHGILEDDPRDGRTEHTARVAGHDLPEIAASGALRIVVAHSPDAVALDTPVAAGGADLLLAGHTHGGQVVLPFIGAVTTHTRLGFAGGRTEIRGMPLIVSRGIGMRGGGAPRVRFGCAPEVGLIEVRR